MSESLVFDTIKLLIFREIRKYSKPFYVLLCHYTLLLKLELFFVGRFSFRDCHFISFEVKVAKIPQYCFARPINAQ